MSSPTSTMPHDIVLIVFWCSGQIQVELAVFESFLAVSTSNTHLPCGQEDSHLTTL